ncbi:hypothetical protein C8R43DRAFT_917900 [Mycena crocata]|nr:hypothetical protein C8R43DRAFT_917900 [Mycena crocata]
MLPKVATHILHSTSRAAAAVHNQSHTIRNVFHSSPSNGTLGPWNGPRDSGGSGSNGPSPGGQKYTGSRFHNGYATRAVTQANAVAVDGSFAQTDEEDIPRVSLSRAPRPRSHSLSTTKPELRVLKTVQLHARSRHAFAASSLAPKEVSPPLVRRNSTASTSVESFDAPPPPPRAPTPTYTVDPAAPQTVSPPAYSHFEAIQDALKKHDPALVAHAVRDLVDNVPRPSVREYNAALEALRETRRPGEPLVFLMQTYNAMLSHSLLPNLRTYFELITAITDRDHEIHTAVTALQARERRGQAAPSDGERIARLRAENTFDSAMKLFETVHASPDGATKIPLYLYVALLRSCANHEHQGAALHVLGALEARTDIVPVASVYKHMIRAYATPTGIDQAETIFSEFLRRSSSGGIDWSVAYDDPDGPRRQHLQVFNQMIEAYFRAGAPDKAVELLERMMNSSAPAAFGASDVPRPASSTYTVVIAGFVHSGDLSTALAWFERLLAQKEVARQPYESSTHVLRPDAVAWQHVLDGCALAGRVDDLNRLFLTMKQCAPRDGLRVRDTDREMVYLANARRLADLSNTELSETAGFLVGEVIGENMDVARMLRPLWEACVSRGMLGEAVAIVESMASHRFVADHPIAALIPRVFKRQGPPPPYPIVARMMRLAVVTGVPVEPEHRVLALHAYAQDKTKQNPTPEDYAFLVEAAVEQEIVAAHRPVGYAFRGLLWLLEDMAGHGVALEDIPARITRKVVKTVFVKHGTDDMRRIFHQLGPRFASVLTDPERSVDALASAAASEASGESEEVQMEVVPEEQQEPRFLIDKGLSKNIEDTLRTNTSGSALAAYAQFENGLRHAYVPSAFVLGKLIQALGRVFELDRVREAYTAAQTLLRGLEADKQAQSAAWFAVENGMIIALAHAGDLESAHVHRMRILEMGGAPSADAYGALILYVKDTTDDTSNALALFQEAQVHRVPPNQYLYNNIISKLAKARKADYALELFEQMKAGSGAAGGVRPSSITYGAVIGACARVGDVHSAENLFEEMMTTPNYRPRIPPFNTMMQLYTTTKPNRERALYYYNQLRTAGIAPTAYTYKLLMDAYGCIEPVDIATMEQIWEALRADPSVELQGNHFATLINAYGCVQKDLDKAVSVFNSIPSFPGAPARDALVFEALINVFVAHRRTDLIPEYVALMNSEGVHMTAYIANFLIKGYADVGDMGQARAIFEGLVDPPSGVAAFNNHAPHEPSASPVIDPMEPVYREPSTWEVMVRAELGSGNRDNATALLERLQARCYPEAVYNRISGILIDHSQVLS